MLRLFHYTNNIESKIPILIGFVNAEGAQHKNQRERERREREERREK